MVYSQVLLITLLIGAINTYEIENEDSSEISNYENTNNDDDVELEADASEVDNMVAAESGIVGAKKAGVVVAKTGGKKAAVAGVKAGKKAAVVGGAKFGKKGAIAAGKAAGVAGFKGAKKGGAYGAVGKKFKKFGKKGAFAKVGAAGFNKKFGAIKTFGLKQGFKFGKIKAVGAKAGVAGAFGINF